MNTEDFDERDELWDLLGKARQPEASPFFSRNVMRQVRSQRQECASFWSWLARHWQVPALAACGITIMVGSLSTGKPGSQSHTAQIPVDSQLMALAQTVSDSPDYSVIRDLDSLLDSESSSVWLGKDSSSTADLY